MFTKLSKVTFRRFLKIIGVSVFFGFCAFVFLSLLMLFYSVTLSIALVLSFAVSVAVFIASVLVFLQTEFVRIVEVEQQAKREMKKVLEKERYLQNNPTVPEYRDKYPDEYFYVFSQLPEAFVNFCPFCGSPIRVHHTWKTERYSSLTGKPAIQSMNISCSGCSDFRYTVKRTFDDGGKDGNQIKRLQGDDLEVIDDDEEGDNQLPPRYEALG